LDYNIKEKLWGKPWRKEGRVSEGGDIVESLYIAVGKKSKVFGRNPCGKGKKMYKKDLKAKGRREKGEGSETLVVMGLTPNLGGGRKRNGDWSRKKHHLPKGANGRLGKIRGRGGN